MARAWWVASLGLTVHLPYGYLQRITFLLSIFRLATFPISWGQRIPGFTILPCRYVVLCLSYTFFDPRIYMLLAFAGKWKFWGELLAGTFL